MILYNNLFDFFKKKRKIKSLNAIKSEYYDFIWKWFLKTDLKTNFWEQFFTTNL